MSDFEKIPGTLSLAKNRLGVVVDPLFSHELVSYDLDGVRYIVPSESGKLGTEYFSFLYISSAYREDAWGVPLPKSLLDRMRKDLPDAFAACGLKCTLR